MQPRLRRTRTRQRTFAMRVALAAAMVAAACSSTPEVVQPSPTPSPSPTATGEPATICEDLLTGALIGGLFNLEPPRRVEKPDTDGRLECHWQAVDGPASVDEDGATLSIIVDGNLETWQGRKGEATDVPGFGEEAFEQTGPEDGGTVRFGAWAVNLGATSEWTANASDFTPEPQDVAALLRIWTAEFLGIDDAGFFLIEDFTDGGSEFVGTSCPTAATVVEIADHPLGGIEAFANTCAWRYLSGTQFFVIRTRAVKPPRQPNPDIWGSGFTVTVARNGDLVVADHRVGCAAVTRTVEVRLFLINVGIDDCRIVQEIADLLG